MIDPRISLGVQSPNVTPAINLFNQAMQRNRQNAIQDQLLPGQLDLQQQKIQSGKLDLQSEQDRQDLRSIAEFATLSEGQIQQAQEGNIAPLMESLTQRKLKLQSEGRNTEQTDELISAIGQGQIKTAVTGLNNARTLAQQTGLIGRSNVTAGQMDRASLMKELEGATNEQGMLKPIEELTVSQRLAAVEGGLIPKASISAQERIATDPTLTSKVASSQAEISGAQEGAKLEEQRQKLPNIRRLVKTAELEAAKQNEVFTDLNRAKAGLPGLNEVVGKLKSLAPIATSTFGGKVYDEAAKQLGFGSTKGATARARFIATIDNQVLPLLRETFGAAFTAAEGDRLRDALADPDASSDAKVAQLESFIEQKYRNIETSEAELLGLFNNTMTTNPASQQPQTQSIGRFQIQVID